MRIKFRLALIAGIPLLFVLAISIPTFITSLQNLRTVKEARVAVETSGTSSALIAELQRERGLTAAYISAQGQDFTDRLANQRQATDKAIAAFKDAFETSNELVADANDSLGRIFEIRNSVDTLSVDLDQSTQDYRYIVNNLLELISGAMDTVAEDGLGTEPAAYIAVLRAKELSGLERSMGATGFTAGYFSADVYRQFAQFRGAQEAALRPALKKMSPNLASEAASLLEGQGAQDIIRLRKLADDSMGGAELPLGLGSEWFDAASLRINGYTKVENGILERLLERADSMAAETLRNLIAMTVAALICFGGTVVFATSGAMQIVKAIFSVTDNLREIGARRYNFDIFGEDRKDEIGIMARSLAGVRHELVEAEKVNIESIYKGSGFDGSSIAMMIIDRDFNIIYANKATLSFFDEYGHEIRKDFPDFDSNKLLGTCIDIFHKDASHQRKILADPNRLPFRSELIIGDLRVSINVSGVYNQLGDYVGNTLEWVDVTRQRLNEGILSTIDRTQCMVEYGVDGRVMSANNNFLKIMGYTALEVKDKDDTLFFKPDMLQGPDYKSLWDRLRNGEALTQQVIFKAKSGDDVYFNSNYIPVLDRTGLPFKIVQLAIDVTKSELEQMAAEELRLKRVEDLSVVIDNLAAGLVRISNGDYSQKIDIFFAEEYRALRMDFNQAVTKLAEADAERRESEEAQNMVVSHLEDVLLRLSEGDVSVRLNEAFASAYEGMRHNFNQAIESLSTAMSSVVNTGIELNDGASEVSRASDDLSQRTERQAATLEETTATITEITTTVAQSAEGAKDVSSIVRETKTQTENSSQIVENAVTAMGKIEESSTEISSIINVIDDIAFQTNLLALNAGVEAARAGDAGRGFAVVAQEVRSLAQRCTGAAKEIKELISASADNVSAGVKLVNSTGEALRDIAERIGKISNLAEEIATSSEEQSVALQEVTKAVSELDAVTQQNAAMVEETTAASHTMKDNAAQLAELMSRFKIEDSGAGFSDTAHGDNEEYAYELAS